MKEKWNSLAGALFAVVGAAPTWTTALVLSLLGIAGSTTALAMRWLAPVLIILSILLLARAFYILYVLRRGNRASAVVTWLAALFVVGYWTWQWLPI